MWERGDQVMLRTRKQGRLSWITPVTVVEDMAECVALFVAVDTPLKRPVNLDGSPIPRSISYEERSRLPWKIGDGQWIGSSVLWVARPGDAFSVGMFWSGADHQFTGWYVNLQAPLVRTPVGFDTEDHVLDIKAAPDRSWHWKDEVEFADAERIGRFTSAEASAIRAQGEAAIAIIEKRGWPFNENWENWRPDPSWSVPSVPDGWDQTD